MSVALLFFSTLNNPAGDIGAQAGRVPVPIIKNNLAAGRVPVPFIQNTLAGDIGTQVTRGVVAPASDKQAAARLSPPGQRRPVTTAANFTHLSHTKMRTPQAVAAILGEASNQGNDGMLAVACALRNRGTLSGVYGIKNPVVTQATPQVRAQALNAWHQSATAAGPRDLTGGATHWGTREDVRKAAFYSRLTFTVKIGDHYFFRAPNSALRT